MLERETLMLFRPEISQVSHQILDFRQVSGIWDERRPFSHHSLGIQFLYLWTKSESE